MSDFAVGLIVGACTLAVSVALGVVARLAFDMLRDSAATRRARPRGGW